ncbi:MAG: PspA/IM30 family protein [Acetobacteraceae bacterium]
MIKTVITLIRGSAAAAAEDLADRNALLILDQQMRDAQASLGRAQRALAVALAEDAQEGRRIDAAVERIARLEDRARAALAGSRQDLALEAAEAIALLEAERDAGRQARALFATEIARLRRGLADAEQRLAALHRGRRVARVAEAVRVSRRGRIEAADNHECTLSEAEATLLRLRERQAQAASADAFLDGLTEATRPQTVEARLAEAGFGPPDRPTAASVLARLNATPNQGE